MRYLAIFFSAVSMGQLMAADPPQWTKNADTHGNAIDDTKVFKPANEWFYELFRQSNGFSTTSISSTARASSGNAEIKISDGVFWEQSYNWSECSAANAAPVTSFRFEYRVGFDYSFAGDPSNGAFADNGSCFHKLGPYFNITSGPASDAPGNVDFGQDVTFTKKEKATEKVSGKFTWGGGTPEIELSFSVDPGTDTYNGQDSVRSPLKKAIVQNAGGERRVWARIRQANQCVSSVSNGNLVAHATAAVSTMVDVFIFQKL